MTPKPSRPIPRISKKRLAALGGVVPFRTTGRLQVSDRSGTPKARKQIPAKNPERQAKRNAAYRKGLAAYRKSETAKIVKERAGGRCERLMTFRYGESPILHRCEETDGLQHHHLRYALRFGGNELPEDMLLVCKRCHTLLEALKPAKNRFTRGNA